MRVLSGDGQRWPASRRLCLVRACARWGLPAAFDGVGEREVKRPADDPGERATRCGRERGTGSFQEAGGGKFTSGL